MTETRHHLTIELDVRPNTSTLAARPTMRITLTSLEAVWLMMAEAYALAGSDERARACLNKAKGLDTLTPHHDYQPGSAVVIKEESTHVE